MRTLEKSETAAAAPDAASSAFGHLPPPPFLGLEETSQQRLGTIFFRRQPEGDEGHGKGATTINIKGNGQTLGGEEASSIFGLI